MTQDAFPNGRRPDEVAALPSELPDEPRAHGKEVAVVGRAGRIEPTKGVPERPEIGIPGVLQVPPDESANHRDRLAGRDIHGRWRNLVGLRVAVAASGAREER